MVRAASSGRLDYSKLDLRDRLQRAKEQLVLAEIEREAWQDWMNTAHRQMVGLMTAQLSDESRQNIQPIMEDILNRVGKTTLPWERWIISDQDKKEAQQAKLNKAKTDYERAFGALSSTKVEEALHRARLFMLADRLVGRAKRERRTFNDEQTQWIRDAVEAQQGSKSAWKRISRYRAVEIVKLFSDVFHRKDLKADVDREFGAA